MDKVAIIGANGYIGKHLATFLQNQDIHLTLFDLQAAAFRPGFDYHACDITSQDFWSSFHPENYQAVYFLGGLSGPEASFNRAEVFLDVNIKGLLLLLQKMVLLGGNAPKILFPSSRLVYRGGATVDEDSPTESRSVYAATKIACEGLLSAYYHRFGIPYSVLRICVPFGNLVDKNYSYGTLGFFVQNAMKGLPITVYGDGKTIKTYTHILDICEIFQKLEEQKDAIGIFNAGGHDYALEDVARLVATRYDGEVVHIPWPESSFRVEMGNISLNSEKLARAVGFSHYRRMDECINDL